MARIRIGPVRVGGRRGASITGGIGPIGVTIGGRRKSSRSRGDSGSDYTSGDSYEPYVESPAERHQRECETRVRNLAEDFRLFDPKNAVDDEFLGSVLAGMFCTWFLLSIVTALSLSHLSRSIWVTFIFLSFAQTVSSPVEDLLPKKNFEAAIGFSISWAHARVIPIATMVPIALNLVLVKFLQLYTFDIWDNSNVNSTFKTAFITYWVVTISLVVFKTKTRLKKTNDETLSAIGLLFFNFIGAPYGPFSMVRLTLIRHRLIYVNARIDIASKLLTTEPGFVVDIESWREIRTILQKTESTIASKSRTGRSPKNRTEHSKTIETNLSHLGPRSSPREKPNSDSSASASRSTKPPVKVQQPSPQKMTSAVTNKPTSASNSRPLSYRERLQMTSDERDGKSASEF